MSRVHRSLMTAALALLVATPVRAQDTVSDGSGSTVAFIGGAVAAASTAGAMLGGTLLYDLNDRLSLEGHGAWFDRGSGATALGLNGSLLVNILPRGNALVPYAAIGGGLYRASFDLSNGRFPGPLDGAVGAGSQFCPSPGAGYMYGPGSAGSTCVVDASSGSWGIGNMPHFYANRLGMLVVPARGMWGTRAFTDPAVAFGGGVRLTLATHLELRPDARAIVVLDGRDRYTVGMFGVNIGYRF